MSVAKPISNEARDRFRRGQALQFSDPPDFSSAERCFRDAIAFAPDWGEAFHALGTALAQQNKLEGACKAERKAIELLPLDPRPRIALGWNLRLLGNYSEAIPILEDGLKLKPHYAEADARFMLAEVYEHIGQIDKAASLWRQIMGMDSTYPSYDRPMEEAKRKLAEHGLIKNDAHPGH